MAFMSFSVNADSGQTADLHIYDLRYLSVSTRDVRNELLIVL